MNHTSSLILQKTYLKDKWYFIMKKFLLWLAICRFFTEHKNWLIEFISCIVLYFKTMLGWFWTKQNLRKNILSLLHIIKMSKIIFLFTLIIIFLKYLAGSTNLHCSFVQYTQLLKIYNWSISFRFIILLMYRDDWYRH